MLPRLKTTEFHRPFPLPRRPFGEEAVRRLPKENKNSRGGMDEKNGEGAKKHRIAVFSTSSASDAARPRAL